MNIMSKEERKQVGSRIKQLRKEKGLSQEDLANLVGLKVGTISKYEQGERTPGISQLVPLAEALGCKSSDFLPTEDGEYKATLASFYENGLDTYIRWLGYSKLDCTPCKIKQEDGEEESAYLIKFDNETFPVSEDTLSKIMDFSKEQFKLIMRQMAGKIGQ